VHSCSVIPHNYDGPDFSDSENEDQEHPRGGPAHRSHADESISDPLVSLMQRVEQFQSSIARSIPRPGFDPEYSEEKGGSPSANEIERALPDGAAINSAIETPPYLPGSPVEVSERLEQSLRETHDLFIALENLLRTAGHCKTRIDRWWREMETLELILGEMSMVESGRIREWIARLRKRRRRIEEFSAQIYAEANSSSSTKLRARRMKEQYTALAALLLERYREIQLSHAAEPRIEARLKALIQIRNLVARLLREDPVITSSLSGKTREGLLYVRKACSTLALELLEEPPPPPPADTLDVGPPPEPDPALLKRLADDLMRRSPLPALFMEPDMLHLQQLRNSLTNAIIDYRDRLESHRRRCCPDPMSFEKRFEDFVRSILIPKVVEPMKEDVRTHPDHAYYTQQILQRMLDLASVPRRPSFI